MKRSMKHPIVVALIVGLALSLGAYFLPGPARAADEVRINGFTISVPESSIPRPGRIHTNYFIAKSDVPNTTGGPPPGTETPGSLACVYGLVKGPKGCPVNTSSAVPTGGWGAIAIVDAGYYPTAKSDLDAFSKYFHIPKADFTVVYANGHRPPIYSDWEVEEALDIEWAHAMAPKAKLFLVESKLCTTSCTTDPSWRAIEVAGKLVAKNGGGVVSMSFGDGEISNESDFDRYFKVPGVVYFAASGDSGIGPLIYPAASPNVVSVGGTQFNRDSNGDFVSETYGGGGGGISSYEPIPSYQSVIKKIVGNKRGNPDVSSDFCCTGIYLQGQWGAVGGTSWSSPTFAGIVNAAGGKMKSTTDELTVVYKEYTDKKEYKADFHDITQGSSDCKVGWDFCGGVGSPRTYKGK
jgi:kumamolisin